MAQIFIVGITQEEKNSLKNHLSI